jgi:hypothetical protein
MEHQPHCLPNQTQHPIPVVRASTCLDTDQARLLFGENTLYVIPPELSAQDSPASRVCPMHLKYLLRNVQPSGCHLIAHTILLAASILIHLFEAGSSHSLAIT